MSKMKQVYWQLKNSFQGVPKQTDFELIEENLADLEDEHITIEALYLSPDPYQKLFSGALQTPCTMMGSLVAKGEIFLWKLIVSLVQILIPESNWDKNHYCVVFRQNWAVS